MKAYKVIALYLLVLFFFSCGTQKETVEKVYVKDSIAYSLPGRTEISLSALCDTIRRAYFKAESGPVKTEIRYVKSDPRLVIQYDTVFKEKIKYVDRIKKEIKKEAYTPKWVKFYGWLSASLIILLIFIPGLSDKVRTMIFKTLRIPL